MPKKAGPREPEANELVVSYMFLRKTVGWIGTLLPIALIASDLFLPDRPDSMSGYYYTHMRNVFVGALCALGVFLVAYAGYDEIDRWITNIAGCCAIGVAFCPTKPAVCAAAGPACVPPSVSRLTTAQQIVGDVHLVLAIITFTCLGLMALRFAKTAPTPPGLRPGRRLAFDLGFDQRRGARRGTRKERLNVIYHGCGIAILGCVALAIASNFLPARATASVPLLFIFEALAVFGFGISWFVKGRTLQTLLPFLRDSEPADPGAPAAVLA